ncbi:MAG: YaaR family protein [Oscillospiraceae bacterium]|nr:YaaR family protein [Oscillospiraceae bacterium]
MSMRVQGQKATETGTVAVRSTDAGGQGDGDTKVFSRTLTQLTNEMHNEKLATMREQIEEQGKKLGDRVDVREFEKYRRLIRDFLDEIVSNGYTFSREDSYASRGRHRYIATVRVIDKRLDELAKEVMKEQSDQLEVLNAIDDIRGLLLDMML